MHRNWMEDRDSSRAGQRRGLAWTSLLAAFVLLLGLAVACDSDGGDGNGNGNGGQDTAGGGQDTGGGGGEDTGGGGEDTGEEANRVEVSLVEFSIAMSATLPAGLTTFVVTNDGEMTHNFEIEGNGIEESLATDLAPGATDELTVDLQPGSYDVYCPIGSHRDLGMDHDLTVN